MKTIAPRSILASILTGSAAVILAIGGAGLALAAAAEPQAGSAEAGAAPAPSPTLTPPRLLLEALERSSPGWVTVESESGPQGGRLVIERLVWPLFYLHWRPLAGGVGDKLSVTEAEQTVAGLWKGLVFDAPPRGQKVSLPAHDAVLIEGTTSHGEWRSRYLVWACPESGRLFIADMSVNLQASAPPGLFELMASMARSVRCHDGARLEELPPPAKRREIPDTDVSYVVPYAWAPVAGYRMQDIFGTGQFSAKDHAAVTSQTGQDLALELDSVRRLQVLWEAAPDEAMTFDVVTQQVQSFWQERATNVMPGATRVSNDIWMMDGLVQIRSGFGVPPARMHKFRAWSWRRNGTSYLAVGQLGGVRFGQRVMTEIQEIADPMLEELFQSIEY